MLLYYQALDLFSQNKNLYKYSQSIFRMNVIDDTEIKREKRLNILQTMESNPEIIVQLYILRHN